MYQWGLKQRNNNRGNSSAQERTSAKFHYLAWTCSTTSFRTEKDAWQAEAEEKQLAFKLFFFFRRQTPVQDLGAFQMMTNSDRVFSSSWFRRVTKLELQCPPLQCCLCHRVRCNWCLQEWWALGDLTGINTYVFRTCKLNVAWPCWGKSITEASLVVCSSAGNVFLTTN